MAVVVDIWLTGKMDLADFLAQEVDRTSYRAVEAKTGISRGSLDNLIRRENKKLPEIETLKKVSKGYGLPLWKVVEMAGVELDLPNSPSERSQRLADLVSRVPQFSLLVDHLLRVDPDNADGILVYLEALELMQNRANPSDGMSDRPNGTGG